eukprot:gene21036-biopygen10148
MKSTAPQAPRSHKVKKTPVWRHQKMNLGWGEWFHINPNKTFPTSPNQTRPDQVSVAAHPRSTAAAAAARRRCRRPPPPPLPAPLAATARRPLQQSPSGQIPC